MNDYAEFVSRKTHRGADEGFAPVFLPDFLFDFQSYVCDRSIRRGRSSVFADCGLGKTPMQLVWSENVVRHTNKPVLILTPLAVAQQTIREAAKFGIEAERSSGEHGSRPRIVVTNYERLRHFEPSDFAGVVCDESSAIKAFDGRRRSEVTEFMRRVPYRLMCTATAAPNDYIELGTASEALGIMGQLDMLSRFFVNDQNTCDMKRNWRLQSGSGGHWRFKGHAELPFWRWVCSWAIALRRPSDLGFDDSRFVLPPCTEREHVVETRSAPAGELFARAANGFHEERQERRRTIRERCERVAALVDTQDPAVVWCHLNDEGDLLEGMIPGARQVSGSQSDEAKEEAYEAFATGNLRVLVIKPKIGAWGLNWQHCAHVVTFASHSYEQFYQSVRRCWRFGQRRPVTVDIVYSEGEMAVKDNLKRKAEAADRMFAALVEHMQSAHAIRESRTYGGKVEVPKWATA